MDDLIARLGTADFNVRLTRMVGEYSCARWTASHCVKLLIPALLAE